jgi:hypothetical protein
MSLHDKMHKKQQTRRHIGFKISSLHRQIVKSAFFQFGCFAKGTEYS